MDVATQTETKIPDVFVIVPQKQLKIVAIQRNTASEMWILPEPKIHSFPHWGLVYSPCVVSMPVHTT